MKIRFQADADFNQVILLATVRREPAIDFRTALDAELSGLSDREVLTMASSEGRILVTHDRRTMPRFFSESLATETSSGVIIVPQNLSVHAAVEDLLLIWSATEAEEWINRLCFLPL